MLQPTSNAFAEKSTEAIGDTELQEALGILRTHSIPNRNKAAANLPELSSLLSAS